MNLQHFRKCFALYGCIIKQLALKKSQLEQKAETRKACWLRILKKAESH